LCRFAEAIRFGPRRRQYRRDRFRRNAYYALCPAVLFTKFFADAAHRCGVDRGGTRITTIYATCVAPAISWLASPRHRGSSTGGIISRRLTSPHDFGRFDAISAGSLLTAPGSRFPRLAAGPTLDAVHADTDSRHSPPITQIFTRFYYRASLYRRTLRPPRRRAESRRPSYHHATFAAASPVSHYWRAAAACNAFITDTTQSYFYDFCRSFTSGASATSLLPTAATVATPAR
jgi:hypothetical protein